MRLYVTIIPSRGDPVGLPAERQRRSGKEEEKERRMKKSSRRLVTAHNGTQLTRELLAYLRVLFRIICHLETYNKVGRLCALKIMCGSEISRVCIDSGADARV